MLGCVVGPQPSLEGQGRLPGGGKSTTVIVTITIITLRHVLNTQYVLGRVLNSMGHILMEQLHFSHFTDVETEAFGSPSHIVGR